MTLPEQPNVVVIDGRSGSGKTTLAAEIAERIGTPEVPAQTLHLDSLYAGWGGLAEGSKAVSSVLERGWYEPYDWNTGQFSSSRINLDPGRPLVIEGCGSLTEANLESAREWAGNAGVVESIWIECDEALRRARALTRDGAMFAPHWDAWAEQEAEHYTVHQPWLFAEKLRLTL